MKRKKIIMKTFKFLTIIAVALVFGLSTNNFAFAKDSAKFSVAVVDTQKIVENSPQISALKTEQRNKLNDLAAFVEKAKADVAKQTDATKKKSLEESYNKELNSRKSDIDKEYVKKLTEFDKSVTSIIKSKSVDYDLVLVKSSVLNGGKDITAAIIKELK